MPFKTCFARLADLRAQQEGDAGGYHLQEVQLQLFPGQIEQLLIIADGFPDLEVVVNIQHYEVEVFRNDIFEIFP